MLDLRKHYMLLCNENVRQYLAWNGRSRFSPTCCCHGVYDSRRTALTDRSDEEVGSDKLSLPEIRHYQPVSDPALSTVDRVADTVRDFVRRTARHAKESRLDRNGAAAPFAENAIRTFRSEQPAFAGRTFDRVSVRAFDVFILTREPQHFEEPIAVVVRKIGQPSLHEHRCFHLKVQRFRQKLVHHRVPRIFVESPHSFTCDAYKKIR